MTEFGLAFSKFKFGIVIHKIYRKENSFAPTNPNLAGGHIL